MIAGMQCTGAGSRSWTRGFFDRGAAALLAWLWAASLAGAATFTATLDRDTITLGETAVLALTFSDGQPQATPTVPAVPGLQIAYLGPSSRVTIINNQTSSTTTHNFRLVPRQAGDFTIPAITATIDGHPFRSAPLVLRVRQPSAPSQATINSGQEIAFLKLVVPKTEVFVGESFVVQLQLHIRQGVQGIAGFEMANFPPDASSGWLAGKSVQGRQTQTQVGNSLYTVVPLSIPIRALRPGTMALGPITATAALEVASPNRRPDPFRDRFGIRGLFGDDTETRTVSLTAEGAVITSLPLPGENVPPHFNGAVGSFQLSFAAGPTNVAAGDPITVKAQVSGRGSLEALTLPEQPAWRGFKIYPPTSKVETSDPLGLTGAKTFEQVVVPENAGLKELPALVFSYFDPEQRQYRTVQGAAIPLVVRPGGATPTPTIAAAGGRSDAENAPPTRDIVHIKQRLGAVGQIGPPLVFRPWFAAAQVLPVGVFLAALLWRRRADRLANNPRLRRRQEADATVRRGLADLQRLAATNDSDAFFATLFRLLQERLGERLDLPASAITEAVIEERLRPAGVPEAVLTPLQELFSACNSARYAPAQSSQELAAVRPRAESVLNQLRDLDV